MQALGSAANLVPWYDSGISILHICLVCGAEEVLLIGFGCPRKNIFVDYVTISVSRAS